MTGECKHRSSAKDDLPLSQPVIATPIGESASESAIPGTGEQDSVVPDLERQQDDVMPSEPMPLTTSELADYLGVSRARVQAWITTNAVKTVSVGDSIRIPFSEYERRVRGRRNLALMKKRLEMRLYLTVLINEGSIVERGYRNGHPVFVHRDFAS